MYSLPWVSRCHTSWAWPQKARLVMCYYTNMTSVWCFHQDILPRERIVARGRSPRATILSRRSYSWWNPHTDVISVLLYRTKTKHKRGKTYKHQRFWMNTRRLPCWTSFAGRSLGKLCRCSGIILRASGDYSTNSWLLPWIIQLFHELLRTTACH